MSPTLRPIPFDGLTTFNEVGLIGGVIVLVAVFIVLVLAVKR